MDSGQWKGGGRRGGQGYVGWPLGALPFVLKAKPMNPNVVVTAIPLGYG